MNDPHVDAVIYRLRHGDECDYDKAPPTKFDDHSSFEIKIEKLDPDNPKSGTFVRFEMKDHCATEDEARAICEPFIESWELRSLLETGPGQFWLEFEESEIIDRNPSPNTLVGVTGKLRLRGGIARVHVGRTSYPSPPSSYAVDDPVRNMALHYRRFRQGQEPLGAMAAFCLTALEGGAGNRKSAAAMYGVSLRVLNKLGEITAEAGGEHARKYKGASRDFSSQERKWLAELTPLLIDRAAKVANDPQVKLPQITMTNLPDLCGSSAD